MCAEQGIIIRGWPFACPFPTETRADKGIEGCSIAGLRLLLESFRDPDHPIIIKKVETAVERQGEFDCNIYLQHYLIIYLALLDGRTPVIMSTVSLTEPKAQHLLFHDNKKVAIVPSTPSTPSKSRKLEPLLSSELTDLDESDTEHQPEQPPAPTKKRDTTTKRAQSNKRSITVSSGSPASDVESPPKRSKKSRTSESSIEVSEVSEAVKIPKRRTRATAALTSGTAGRASAGSTSKSDSKPKVKSSGKRKTKSKAYIESDDEETEKAPEELEEAIGALLALHIIVLR